MDRIGDILAAITIIAVLVVTCMVSDGQSIETSAMQTQINQLQAQLDALSPVPRINVQRAAIYPVSGEVIIDSIEVVKK